MRADPELTSGWTAAQLGSVLIHHVCHLLRTHGERAQGAGVRPDEAADWVRAADAEINDDLVQAGLDLPGQPVLPRDLRAEDGLLAEQYFEGDRRAAFVSAPSSFANTTGGRVEDCFYCAEHMATFLHHSPLRVNRAARVQTPAPRLAPTERDTRRRRRRRAANPHPSPRRGDRRQARQRARTFNVRGRPVTAASAVNFSPFLDDARTSFCGRLVSVVLECPVCGGARTMEGSVAASNAVRHRRPERSPGDPRLGRIGPTAGTSRRPWQHGSHLR